MKEQFTILNRLADLVEQANRQYRTTATSFLTPAEQKMAGPYLSNRRIPFSFEGGYDQAERRRCLLWADVDQAPDLEDFIAATEIQPINAQTGLSHRDYLGALLGSGLKREQLGDILVHPDRAIVIHHPALLVYFQTQLEQVGSSPVRCRQMLLSEVVTTGHDSGELQTISVSSLRLDVVLGAIFQCSRSQSLELIRRGLVQIDWVECQKPDQMVAVDQTVTLRGSGRARLVECAGQSRKGKIRLIVERTKAN